MLLPVMQAARWKDFEAAIDVLSKYINKATKMQQAYDSLTRLHSIGDGTSSHMTFVVGASVRKPNLMV